MKMRTRSLRVSRLGFRVLGLGFRVWDLGLGSGFGMRVKALMFRVLGSGRNECFICVQTITRRSDESDSGDDSYRYHHFIALTFSTEIVLFCFFVFAGE